MTDATAPQASLNATPFWISLALIPIVWVSTAIGGWAIFLVPLSTWVLFAGLDAIVGVDASGPSTATPDSALFWHRMLTLIWVPLQVGTVFGVIGVLSATSHLSVAEELGIAFGLGILSGTIGIVYAHELLHQKPRVEREFADILLASVLYSHFRSEHLLVHHRYVGTPKDTVTARYNEGFHRFFYRVLRTGFRSAWLAEKELLEKRGKSAWASDNPFWKYAAFQMLFFIAAFWIGGIWGVVLFVFQAFIAIWQLELVNYVEHYGLTRRHLGNGRYERTGKHHSWNSTKRATNWLLINLQRHSDHHSSPNRRFPLLQATPPDEAPELPYGYPVMTTMAMIPPLWRRRMNPRVRAWRREFYPDISDWKPYNKMTNPMPN